ncbi:MAG: PadR family transcriptional regulator [Planctomycetota bacterium]|jgi:DNA-binding PadR family transcriptional regulator
MAIKKTILDGNVETMLLAILDRAPSYGYEIVRLLNEQSSGVLSLGEGTVYPVLHRLEKRKLISSFWEKTDSGRPRKYYRLTKAGTKLLAENRQQWASLVQVMDAFLSPSGKEASNRLLNGGVS